MVRELMHDEAFLAQKAEPATPEDLPVARDLPDTLTAHKDGCVGMAANMIGVNKRITGWTAQIIQHEIDHCEGILISCCMRLVDIVPPQLLGRGAPKSADRNGGK